MHPEWENLLPFYVNGTLSAVEKGQLENHLLDCENCQAALEDWKDIAAAAQSRAQHTAVVLPPLRLPPTAQPNSNHQEENLKMYTPIVLQPPKRRLAPMLTLAAAIALTFLTISLMSYLPRLNTALPIVPQAAEDEKVVILQQYIDVWSGGDAAVLNEILTPDHRLLDTSRTDVPVGVEAITAHIENLRSQVKDLQGVVDETITSGDTLWARLTFTAFTLLTGETTIESPQGTFTMPASIIVRFVDGKIAETWMNINHSELVWAMLGYYMDNGADIATLAQEQENKQLAQRVIDEIWNSPDVSLETVQELYATRFQAWMLWPDGTDEEDSHWWIFTVQPFKRAFPDMHLTVETIMADDDQVIVGYSAQGTFENELCSDCQNNTVQPTGEVVHWTGTFTYRIQDGEIVEERWAMDLGLIAVLMESWHEETTP